MKKWADMTERERDVLVAQTLGWEVVDVSPSRTFKAAEKNDNWYPVTTSNPQRNSYDLGWLEGGVHWTREGDKIHYGKITNEGMEDTFRAWKIPHFSTDHASAMTLLDDAHGYVVGKSTDGHFYCIIIDKDYEYHRAPSQNSNAEAICLAFLLYKGVEIE